MYTSVDKPLLLTIVFIMSHMLIFLACIIVLH